MLLGLGYPLLLGAAMLAVLMRSPGILGAVGIVAMDAVGGTLCALSLVKDEETSTKISATISGLVLGGGVAYLISLPPEEFGWVAFGVSTLLILPLILMMILVFGFLQGPSKRVGRWLSRKPKEKPDSMERAIVRLGIPALLLASCGGAVVVSLRTPKAEIPSFAFSSHVVLAVQLVLLFFYGSLLLLVPLVRAVSSGELPIELSLKGARFAEEKLGQAAEEFRGRLKVVEDKSFEVDTKLNTDVATLNSRIEHAQSVAEVNNQTQEAINDRAIDRIADLEAQIKDLSSRASSD